MVVHRKSVCDLFLSPLPVNRSLHRLGAAILSAAHPHTHRDVRTISDPAAKSEGEELGTFRSAPPDPDSENREEKRRRKVEERKTKNRFLQSGSTGFILQASLCLATTQPGINCSEPFTTCTHHTLHHVDGSSSQQESRSGEVVAHRAFQPDLWLRR